MNMKKLGSLLTSVSMIASMATYVPMSVSASTPVTSGSFEGGAKFSIVSESDVYTLTISKNGENGSVPASCLEAIANVSSEDAVTGVTYFDDKNINIVFENGVTIAENAFKYASGEGEKNLSVVNVTADCTVTVNGEDLSETSLTTAGITKTTGTFTDSHDFANEWTTDGDNHWHACTNPTCEEREDQATHSKDRYVNNGSTHSVKCSVCDKVVIPSAEHIYEATDSGATPTQHIKACICGASTMEDHTPIVTKNDASTHNITCADCGYVIVRNENHNLKYEENSSDDKHKVSCEKNCGYSDILWCSSFDYADNGDGTHTKECDQCGKKIANEAHDTDGPNGACSKCGYSAYSGTITGVLANYPTVSYKIDCSDAKNGIVLTISPKTEGAAYTIPDNLLYEVSYSCISKNNDFDTESEVANKVRTIKIVGAAKISDKAFAFKDAGLTLNATKVEIDCQATYETAADTFAKIAFDASNKATTKIYGLTTGIVEITHDMLPNKEKNNHKCRYEDKVDASYSAHDFTAAGGATVGNGEHVCACGKSSEDYRNATADAADDNYDSTNYNKIHTWNAKTHVCDVCGVDHVDAHSKQFTAIDAKTHKTVCSTCGKTLASAAEHNFAPTWNTVSNKPVFASDCEDCGYVHGETDHVYEYVWKYTDEDESPEFVKVGTATGLVCACGDIKAHSTHNYVKAYKAHLCGCGVLYDHQDSDYTQRYNEKGVLIAVSVEKGVICPDCGAVKAHKCQNTGTATNVGTYYDTTKHEHYCFCGEKIASPKHSEIIDEENQKHVCEYCLAEGVSDHAYKYVMVVSDGVDESDGTTGVSDTDINKGVLKTVKQDVGAENGLICDCGAIKTGHTHTYAYGINEDHYCACGAKEATPTHDYKTVTAKADGKTYKQCIVCGKLENHTHDFAYTEDCTCTNPLCTVSDHDFEVVGNQHICQNCGTVGDPTDDATHNYKVDTVNHKHVCDCGAIKATHNVVDHVCECGYTEHSKSATKVVDGKTVHYCSGILDDGTVCGYVFTAAENYGHEYAVAGNDKCTVRVNGNACGELNPKHVHAPASVSGTANDTCRCGKEIAHEYGLSGSAPAVNHQCVNYVYTVDSTGKLTKTNDRCTHSAAHKWTATDNVTAIDFCECGAMNPDVLVKAGVLVKNGTYAQALNFDDSSKSDYLPSRYTTSYLVTLKKAYNAALEYAVQGGYADVSKILLATDGTAQVTALDAVDTFKAVWAERLDYQAASSAVVDFVIEKDADGKVTVDHEDRGYAVYSDGSKNEFGRVYGKVGEVVTIQVKPKSGYTFAGWYSTETPSSTDKPICTTAAFEVTIKDGHFPYYAKFEENAKQTITFNEGIKYYSSVTAPDDGDNWTNGTKGYPATKGFLTNEEVIIMPDAKYFSDASKAVTGIKDKFGNIVEYNCKVNGSSTNNAYKFNVTYGNNFTVSTYSNSALTGTQTYVQFQVGGKIVSGALLPTKDVTSIQPADPEKVGFKFEGWVFTGNENGPVEALKSVSQNTGVLVPKFTVLDDLTVKVVNGTIDKDYVKETYTYGDKILITADLQNAAGKYFSGWFDENGNLVSKYRTAKINVTKSMVLTAQYTRDEELVLEPGIDLVANRTTTTLELTATRRLTDEMTLVEIGMLYKVGEVAEADLVIENDQLGRKYKTSVESKNGDYVVTLNLSSDAAKKSTISAISYYIYQDAEGVNHTVYSNAVYAAPVQ